MRRSRSRLPRRLRRLIPLAGLAVGLPGQAGAADPQPYAVTIAATGDAALDAALRDSSDLNTLHDSAPVGPFALVTRAQGDLDRLATALHAFGYYKGAAHIRIADRPLDDPGLPDLLQARPAGPPVPVAVTIERGPLFHLRRVEVTGDVPPEVRGKLGIAAGDPALAAKVLAAGAGLLAGLREDGHALAKVDGPEVLEDPNAEVLDITYRTDPGPRVDIGPIGLSGLGDVNESYVRRRLLIHPGELYRPSKIEAARQQDLSATGVFSSVQAKAADALDPAGRIPVDFTLQERPKHTVGFTAAYSTDLGASAAVTWSDRNLFGNTEQLNLRAAIIDIGGSDSDGIGYDVDAQLIQPDFLHRDQTLTYNLEALKESFEAYDQTAFIASATLARKFSPHWTGTLEVQAEQERVSQEGTTRDYTLLSLPVGARYDNTNDLLEPTRGYRLALTGTPTASLVGSSSLFAVLNATGSTYLDLSGNGHSVIALRATAATVQGASTYQIPPDQRLYAGGSATVRGYKFQSVGPQFADRNPVGGTQLAAATVELRQRIWGDIGMAVFVDAGEVTGARGLSRSGGGPAVAGSDTSGKLAIGAGVGARYITPIGPIRLDVAVPVQRFPGGDSFELYIGIGEAF